MKKRRLRTGWLSVAVGLIVLIGACARPETVDIPAVGDTVVERYDLSGFDEVEVAGFFEAQITQGEDYQVVVEAERRLLPYLEVELSGKRLQVGLKSGVLYNFDAASQRVEITLPTLTRARIDNHSDLDLMGIAVDAPLRLEASDFSTLSGAIEAGEVQVEISNHSTLMLKGYALQVAGEVEDHSTADLTGLEAAGVSVETDRHSAVRE
jgi:hypothetical protein